MFLTILVSSQSFAYYEHICLITKQKTISFEGQTCAGKLSHKQESKTPEFKRSSCCELNLKDCDGSCLLSILSDIVYSELSCMVIINNDDSYIIQKVAEKLGLHIIH
jgi:hypothetical protein